MNNKNKKSKSVLIAVLASLVIVTTASASLMSGCGNNDSTPDEASVVGTSVVSKVIEGTYSIIDNNGTTVVVENGTDADGNIYVQNGTDVNGNEVKVENGTTPNGNKVIDMGKSSGSAKTERSENSETDEQKQNDKSNSDKSSSNTDTKKNDSNDSDKSSKGDNKGNNDDKKSDDSSSLSIGGKSFSVGDTITCVYDLTAPEKLENYQANILYDSKYLEATDAVLEGSAASGSIINYKLDGEIKFNGSYPFKGYDYTKGGKFLTVTYKVKAAGSTAPEFEWVVATGVSGKAYVSDGKATGGMKIEPSYS